MKLSQQFNEKKSGGDENVLELDRGDGYITLWMQMSINFTWISLCW